MIIITSFLLLLVMIFLAFEFDIGRLGIAQVEHKRAASIGSLSAINSYWLSTMEEDGSPIKRRHTKGVEQAQRAAREILGIPANTPLFVENGSADPEIVVADGREPTPGVSTRGILRFGHWHFSEPKDGCNRRSAGACPCSEKKWRGPCFEPFQGGRSDREFATALQLEYFTAEDTPLRYLFAGIFGQHGSSIRARATSSLLSDAGVLSSPRLVEASIIPVSGLAADRSPTFELYETLEVEREKRKAARKRKKSDACKPGIRQWDSPGFYKFATPSHCSQVSIWVWGAGELQVSAPEKVRRMAVREVFLLEF